MSASDRNGSGILQPPWNSMTLPGLIAGAARLRADAPFLADGTNVEPLAHRPRRELTCGELGAEAERLAGQLQTLGLKPGEVVLLHLPNTVEAAIALLGVLIAGGIPAPTAVFEDVPDIRTAADLCGAAAMISIASFAGLTPALKCRSAAVDLLGVRFIAAFGADTPEGVVPLDAFEVSPGGEPPPRTEGAAPCLITFDAPGGQRRALLRSHEQLVAEAAAAAGLARAGAGERLLMTLPPSSVAGVVFGLAMPLMTGASVDLVPLFDSCAFAAQLGRSDAAHVVLPGRSEVAFRQFCEENAVRCETLVLVHRPDPADPALPVPETGHVHCLDVLCLGEAVLAVSGRGAATDAGRLSPALAHPVQGVLTGEAPLLTLNIDRAGQLDVTGPSSPFVLSTAVGAACPTGFGATIDDDGSIRLLSGGDRLSNAA